MLGKMIVLMNTVKQCMMIKRFYWWILYNDCIDKYYEAIALNIWSIVIIKMYLKIFLNIIFLEFTVKWLHCWFMNTP